MAITCRELFEIEHPGRDIDEWCPNNFDYACPRCSEMNEDCNKCWDLEVDNPEKLAAIEKISDKTWGDRIAENLDLNKTILDAAKNIRAGFDDGIDEANLKFKEWSNAKTVNLPYIKDSGERREFETGAVRDIQEGKGRCDLMPLDVVGKWLNSDILTVIQDFKTTGDVDFLYGALTYFVVETSWDDQSMILQTAKHFEAGAVKYGENNWQKGIPVHCYIDSAVRHYLKFLRGDDDEPHDRAFVWNIMCCIWTCVHKPELNDFCEVKEAVEPKGYNPVERAYQMLVDIRDHSEDDDVHMSDIDDIIGYLGEALND